MIERSVSELDERLSAHGVGIDELSSAGQAVRNNVLETALPRERLITQLERCDAVVWKAWREHQERCSPKLIAHNPSFVKKYCLHAVSSLLHDLVTEVTNDRRLEWLADSVETGEGLEKLKNMISESVPVEVVRFIDKRTGRKIKLNKVVQVLMPAQFARYKSALYSSLPYQVARVVLSRYGGVPFPAAVSGLLPDNQLPLTKHALCCCLRAIPVSAQRLLLKDLTYISDLSYTINDSLAHDEWWRNLVKY
jgi:hypothetical protein